MKTILVTGGAGYIGSAVTKALLDSGYGVVVVDNLSNGNIQYVDKRATFAEVDLCHKDALRGVFTNNKIDAVMHFAALKAVGKSEEEPTKYFENNVGGTINLLSVMDDYGVKEIIFSSSAAVYEPPKNGVCTEGGKIGSINVYGTCKYIEETLIRELTRTGKLQKHAILRYFNVAGDAGLQYIDPHPENVFPILHNVLLHETIFNIYGTDYDTRDGTCVRDYIHLDDLVDAHIKALESSASGTWNLGTSSGTTVRELICEFESLSGKKMNVHEDSRRAGDPGILLADATKAKQELGWQAQKTLSDMVKSTLKLKSL